MSAPTLTEVKQALNHLVTVRVQSDTDPDPRGGQYDVTGMLREVEDFSAGMALLGNFAYSIHLTTGFRPGTYDEDDAAAYVLGIPSGETIWGPEIIGFTDHGARDDFDVNLRQFVMQRDHALQALKDAEANLARAYATLTDLTALEG